MICQRMTILLERVSNEKLLLYILLYLLVFVIGLYTFTRNTYRFLCQVFQLLSVSSHRQSIVALHVPLFGGKRKVDTRLCWIKSMYCPSSVPIIEHFRRGELNRISVKCSYMGLILGFGLVRVRGSEGLPNNNTKPDRRVTYGDRRRVELNFKARN